MAHARATRFWERRRSCHLLSGLVNCRQCGSHYASIGRDYLACSAARGSGTCSNRQSLRRAALERIILDGLRQRLMAPELVEEFVRAAQTEINQLRRDDEVVREVKKRELVQQRLDELEGRRVRLEQEIATEASPPVRLHPKLAQVYRRQLNGLIDAQLELAENAWFDGSMRSHHQKCRRN